MNALKRRIATNATLRNVEKEELPGIVDEFYQDANGRPLAINKHPKALEKASKYVDAYLLHRDPTRVTPTTLDLIASNKAMEMSGNRAPSTEPLTNLHGNTQPYVSMMFDPPPTGFGAARQAIINNRRNTLANATKKSDDIRELIANFNKIPVFQRQKALKAVRSSLGPTQYDIFLEGLNPNTDFFRLATQVDRNHTNSARKNVVYQGPGKARAIVQRLGTEWKSNRVHGQRYARNRKGSFQIIEAMQLESTPQNGNDLFYSFANHLLRIRTGKYASKRDRPVIENTMATLRNNVAAYIEKGIRGAPMYDHDAGRTVNPAKYAEYVRTTGTYTGHAVLDALSKLYGIPIYLYTKVPGTTFTDPRMGEYVRQSISFGSNFKKAPLFLVSSIDHGTRFAHTVKTRFNLLFAAMDITPQNVRPPPQGPAPPTTTPVISQTIDSPIPGNKKSRWGGGGGVSGGSGFVLISLTLSCVSSLLKLALNR